MFTILRGYCSCFLDEYVLPRERIYQVLVSLRGVTSAKNFVPERTLPASATIVTRPRFNKPSFKSYHGYGEHALVNTEKRRRRREWNVREKKLPSFERVRSLFTQSYISSRFATHPFSFSFTPLLSSPFHPWHRPPFVPRLNFAFR